LRDRDREIEEWGPLQIAIAIGIGIEIGLWFYAPVGRLEAQRQPTKALVCSRWLSPGRIWSDNKAAPPLVPIEIEF